MPAIFYDIYTMITCTEAETKFQDVVKGFPPVPEGLFEDPQAFERSVKDKIENWRKVKNIKEYVKGLYKEISLTINTTAAQKLLPNDPYRVELTGYITRVATANEKVNQCSAKAVADPQAEFFVPLDWDPNSENISITDILTKEELAAQTKFLTSLSADEFYTLKGWKGSAHAFTRHLVLGDKNYPMSAVEYARAVKGKESVPGYIPTFMANFSRAMFKAPKLTHEINVFRGIQNKAGLNNLGTIPISTSYSKTMALAFSRVFLGEVEKGCCMLKVNVKPGVRIIAIDFLMGEGDSFSAREFEIIICPPFKALVEDVGDSNSGIKKVTITPVVPRRAGTRRKRGARKTRKH